MTKEPKILIYDIEVSPCVFWAWGTGKTNLGAHQLLEYGKIICISYRFYHWPEGKIKTLVWDKKQSDEKLVKKFYKIAKDVDLLIGHNGDSFDRKWVNARLAYYEHPTLEHVNTEDTLKQVRKNFRLPSYRLAFLVKYFKVGGKLSTANDLWEDCTFRNDRKKLKEMVVYCENDTLILDKLYKRLYPYVSHKLNRSLFADKPGCCPECTSCKIQKRGFYMTKTGKYQKYQCQDCGKWFKGGTNVSKYKASTILRGL